MTRVISVNGLCRYCIQAYALAALPVKWSCFNAAKACEEGAHVLSVLMCSAKSDPGQTLLDPRSDPSGQTLGQAKATSPSDLSDTWNLATAGRTLHFLLGVGAGGSAWGRRDLREDSDDVTC